MDVENEVSLYWRDNDGTLYPAMFDEEDHFFYGYDRPEDSDNESIDLTMFNEKIEAFRDQLLDSDAETRQRIRRKVLDFSGRKDEVPKLDKKGFVISLPGSTIIELEKTDAIVEPLFNGVSRAKYWFINKDCAILTTWRAHKTREQKSKAVDVFLKVKGSNMRDYADACFRYLRATGMINVSYVGKTLTIMKEKMEEVKFFLDNTDREPCFVDNERKYVFYLTNPHQPELLTDNPTLLYEKIRDEFPDVYVTEFTPVKEMKEILIEETARRKEKLIRAQQVELKDYKLYEDIQTTFQQIDREELYDIPLMLEWNVWRSMTMLDGGNIKANLKFDDFGKPMSTAQGNVADIVCDYGDFDVIVEVTMDEL